MFTPRNLLFLIFNIVLANTSIGQIGSVKQSLSLGDSQQPTGICWDGSYIWMIDYAHDLIHKIDPASGDLILSFSTPDQFPTGLAYDGNHLWCSGMRQRKIFQLSNTGEIIKSLDVSSSPKGLTFANGYLWYADSNDKKLYKLNPETGTYIDTIPAPGGDSRGLTFDGKYLWCSDKTLKEIYKIDVDYKKIIMIIPAPLDYPYGLCWDGADLWIAGYNSGTLKRMITNSSELVFYIDSLKAHLQYNLTVRNVGSTFMNLRTWICEPYTSLRQTLDSEIVFSPFPLNFTHDQWNQRFAFFNGLINPGDSMVYRMDIDVTCYDMRYNILPDSIGTIGDVPASIQNSYLSDGDYYDIHNPTITDAVNLAIGTETNMYWKARKIHDYIIQEIHYELDGKWDPAPQILTQAHGSCSEYSYLFIAMCRSANIPARYEAGAYNGGTIPYVDEVFHRWTQIYLPPYGWVHVDATWDDREYPANQSRYFGASSKKVFATTLGGGGSNKISWTYNSANSQTGGIRERSKQFIWSEIGTSLREIIPQTDHINLNVYPNPIKDQASISFSLEKHSLVYVRLLNLSGQLIDNILKQYLNPGDHILLWNPSDIAPGTHLIQLVTERGVSTTPCIIVR